MITGNISAYTDSEPKMNALISFNMHFWELAMFTDYEKNKISLVALCEDNVECTLALT